MKGSHKARVAERAGNRHPLVLVALGAVAALLVGGAVFGVTRVSADCDTGSFTVAAEPNIAPVVQQILDDSSMDLGCADLTVKAVEPAEVLGAIGRGREVPAIWLPDSTQWLARAGQSTGMPVDVAANSIAASPVVIVGPEGEETPVADSWLNALKLDGLDLGDPLTSSVASAPIVGGLAETEANQSDPGVVSAAMVPIAQAQLSREPESNQAARMEQVVSDGGFSVVSEQQYVAGDMAVSAAVPSTGSIFLDYPVAVTEPQSGAHDEAKEAALALARALTSPEGFEAMGAAGFRAPNGAELSDRRGVGSVERMRLTDQSLAQGALRSYALLALPTKALAINDVSGSMAFEAGDQTRMQLTSQASETGIGLFPDRAQLGIWAFSTELDGAKDYQELIPVRRMDEEVDGGTHREALIAAVRRLEPKVGGGTGLYDSTLAAFREAKRTYDPQSINSVIVLTDGANDDPGSISLTSLIASLQEEQDPTQPVIIITIGITDDADEATLDKIAKATGGASFVARNPADIPGVFVQALQNRAG